MKCPCEECICLGICRHKEYYMLFIDCSSIKTYMDTADSVMEDHTRFSLMRSILKPTTWNDTWRDDL